MRKTLVSLLQKNGFPLAADYVEYGFVVDILDKDDNLIGMMTQFQFDGLKEESEVLDEEQSEREQEYAEVVFKETGFRIY